MIRFNIKKFPYKLYDIEDPKEKNGVNLVEKITIDIPYITDSIKAKSVKVQKASTAGSNSKIPLLFSSVRYSQITCVYHSIQKRFMGTKVLTPAMMLEQQTILRNKILFLRFCEHFKAYPVSTLLKDREFISIMDYAIREDPSHYSRAFQLALEFSYRKRFFAEKELREHFKNDFIVKDTFQTNNSICDQSVVFNSILSKSLVTYFNYDSNNVVVSTTSRILSKDALNEKQKEMISHNEKLTGNTVPDIYIKSIPFDFKESKKMSLTKNHVYFFDKRSSEKDYKELLFSFYRSWEGTTSNPIMPKDTREFAKTLQAFYKKNEHLNYTKQLELIQRFIEKSETPPSFGFPKFVLFKKSSLKELAYQDFLKEIERICLEKGHLDYKKSQEAIMSIVNTYDNTTKKNIEEITNNSISFALPQQELD